MIYCEDCSSYECGCPEKKEHAAHIAELEAKIARLKRVIEGLTKEKECTKERCLRMDSCKQCMQEYAKEQL